MLWKALLLAIAVIVFLLISATSGFAARPLPLPSAVVSIPSDIAAEMISDERLRDRVYRRIASVFADRYQECSLIQVRPLVSRSDKKLIIAVIIRCRAVGRDAT